MGFKYRNAKIESTFLGYEDNGILTFMFTVSYGGTGQGCGGYRLDDFDTDNNVVIDTIYPCSMLRLLLSTLNINSWEELIGLFIRVMVCDETNKIIGIAHSLNDKYMYFDDIFGKEKAK